MKHIFYFIGILFVIYELLWIINPKSRVEKSKIFTDLSKQFKGKKWGDFSEEYKDVLISKGIPGLILTIWMVAGLLTFNWFAFAVLIVFNTVFIMPLGELFKFSFAYTALHWLNSIIGFAFGLFVIINSYHLKINLYEIVKAWLF